MLRRRLFPGKIIETVQQSLKIQSGSYDACTNLLAKFFNSPNGNPYKEIDKISFTDRDTSPITQWTDGYKIADEIDRQLLALKTTDEDSPVAYIKRIKDIIDRQLGIAAKKSLANKVKEVLLARWLAQPLSLTDVEKQFLKQAIGSLDDSIRQRICSKL